MRMFSARARAAAPAGRQRQWPRLAAPPALSCCFLRGGGPAECKAPAGWGSLHSFYWYDLETSGAAPRWDRIVQFAGLRTDLALEPIGDECATYVNLPDDVVPDPEAALVTGITPQLARREGVSEWQGLGRINELLSAPGTCAVGYNNLRFDDEFIRFGLYRNLMDPYAREWRDGNSRWDILDLARAAGALRPEGLQWPKDDAGLPFYKLEALAAANGLEHGQAHDALFDVRATLALARLLRQRQPRLFDYCLASRLKPKLWQLLEPYGSRVLAHVSGRYPRRRHCFAPVVSVCAHPVNANAVIVADVSEDIEPLLHWPEERIQEALFNVDAQWRPPLKEVRLNRCPFLAPLSVIRRTDAARLGFDAEAGEQRRRRLGQPALADKIRRVYGAQAQPASQDVEAALYDGFIGNEDRNLCARLQMALAQGRWLDQEYADARLTELAARLKARSFAERLTDAERAEWRSWVRCKITASNAPWRTLAEAEARLREMEPPPAASAGVLSDLKDHFRRLKTEYGC